MTKHCKQVSAPKRALVPLCQDGDCKEFPPPFDRWVNFILIKIPT